MSQTPRLEMRWFSSDLKEKIQFAHLTGHTNETERLKVRYRELGFQAFVADYSQEMHLCYGAADLVISRSGAGTVSELIATKRPSILIPYPHATGGHQRFNAEVLSRPGCAHLLEETPQFAAKLSQMIRELMESPENLEMMRQNFDKLPVPVNDASKRLAELVINQK